jgi:hypothetical protein
MDKFLKNYKMPKAHQGKQTIPIALYPSKN